MTQPTPEQRERARLLVPCGDPKTACPFHWNSCWRSGECEAQAEVAQALADEAASATERIAGMLDDRARALRESAIRLRMHGARIGEERQLWAASELAERAAAIRTEPPA